MTTENKALEVARNEVDMLDVLRALPVVHIALPNDQIAARACVQFVAQIALKAEIRAALKPMLDQMHFDMEAVQRGAMPSTTAD